jgi:hypothetical protein
MDAEAADVARFELATAGDSSSFVLRRAEDSRRTMDTPPTEFRRVGRPIAGLSD